MCFFYIIKVQMHEGVVIWGEQQYQYEIHMQKYAETHEETYMQYAKACHTISGKPQSRGQQSFFRRINRRNAGAGQQNTRTEAGSAGTGERCSSGLFGYISTHGEKYVEVRKVFYFLRFIFLCIMRNPCYIVSCQRHGASDGGTFLLITYTCLLSLWGSRQPILNYRSEEVMFLWHIEIGYMSGLVRIITKKSGAGMRIAHGFVVSATV